MQEITCQGNGRIFGISCINLRPESLPASALFSCNKNWNCPVLTLPTYHRGAVSTYQRLGFEFDASGRLVKSLERLVL